MKILLLSFVLFSCTEYSEVKESITQSHIIKPIPFEINEAENITWNVGKQKLTVLSKGVQVIFSLPLIEDDMIQKLFEKYKFDSWIYEVIQKKNSRQIKLGSYYVPFVLKRDKVYHQPERTGFFITYASLYSVPSQTNTSCPYLGHNKFIDDFEIEDVPTSDSYKTIELSSYSFSSYNGSPEKAHYSLNAVNAGSSLVGEYTVRLALFNTSQNKAVSSFVFYPQKIVVNKEDAKLIQGCDGVKQEIPQGKPKIQMKDFKFGS